MPLSDFYADGCTTAADPCTGVATAADPCCYRYVSGTGCYEIDKLWTQCLSIPADTALAIDLSDLEVGDCTIEITTLKDIVVCNRTDTTRTGVIVNVDLPIPIDLPPGKHFSYADPCIGFAGVTTITLTNPDLTYQAEVCLTLAGVSV